MIPLAESERMGPVEVVREWVKSLPVSQISILVIGSCLIAANHTHLRQSFLSLGLIDVIKTVMSQVAAISLALLSIPPVMALTHYPPGRFCSLFNFSAAQ